MKIDSRITLIDALRGYALMGLFLIHMVEYYELYWYKYFPDKINDLMFAIFGGKAYAIFAFLFGFSFYIMMKNHAERGTDFRARFVWRLFLLYLIGFFHTLIYGGDILQILAVCGLILVPLWKVSTRVIIAIASLLILQTPAMAFLHHLNTHPEFNYSQPFFSLFQKPVYEAYAHGNFFDVMRENAWDGIKTKWAFAWEFGRLANITGLGMLGFLAGRTGFFVNREKFKTTYVAGLVLALSAALAIYFSKSVWSQIPHAQQASSVLNNIYENYFNLMLTFISILIFVLIYGFKWGEAILKHWAPAGRMTLTLYVLQSCLFVPFYYGFGLNAYTYVSQGQAAMLGIFVWLITLIGARVWFNHFKMGPLEWLWRAGTFMRTDIAFKGAAKN